jgi:hypothetical protein
VRKTPTERSDPSTAVRMTENIDTLAVGLLMSPGCFRVASVVPTSWYQPRSWARVPALLQQCDDATKPDVDFLGQFTDGRVGNRSWSKSGIDCGNLRLAVIAFPDHDIAGQHDTCHQVRRERPVGQFGVAGAKNAIASKRHIQFLLEHAMQPNRGNVFLTWRNATGTLSNREAPWTAFETSRLTCNRGAD